MSFVKRVFFFIKKRFYKENVKMIESISGVITKNEKESFIKSLKKDNFKKIEKKKIETLICEGDGLGIQGKITY